MSCYEWESGTIKLPTAAFPKFRRDLNAFYNQRQAQLLTKATAIYEKVATELKGKRGADLEQALATHLEVQKFAMGGFATSVEVDGADRLRDVLLPYNATKLVRPLKKHFAPVPLTGDSISGSEWSICFDSKTHCVRWSVSENNHSCERAHEDPVAKEFFALLGRVRWVRGTGGEIVGNDEYRRESEDAGGAANYVKQSYGPKTAENASRAFRSARPFPRTPILRF